MEGPVAGRAPQGQVMWWHPVPVAGGRSRGRALAGSLQPLWEAEVLVSAHSTLRRDPTGGGIDPAPTYTAVNLPHLKALELLQVNFTENEPGIRPCGA